MKIQRRHGLLDVSATLMYRGREIELGILGVDFLAEAGSLLDLKRLELRRA